MHPHRRYNPLQGGWVLCSPQRLQRPWEGQKEVVTTTKLSSSAETEVQDYDKTCKLCPGNDRANGAANPQYASTFVFNNDFPAIFPPNSNSNIPPYTSPFEHATPKEKDLFRDESTSGLCRVICFSPLHTKSLPELTLPQVIEVVEVWTAQYKDLSEQPFLKYATIFENKGAVMGCSNPHPHSQVWATSFVPDEPARELENCYAWKQKHGSCLLCDYVAEEIGKKERVVLENDSFVAVVPFWAVWPFETLIISKSHTPSLVSLHANQKADFAQILKDLLIRYDNIFETSFPYSSGLHQAPFGSHQDEQISHLHMHFYPPLLRSSTIKKFMVGFEMIANPQRDLTAEVAAQRLRDVPSTHFKSW